MAGLTSDGASIYDSPQQAPQTFLTSDNAGGIYKNLSNARLGNIANANKILASTPKPVGDFIPSFLQGIPGMKDLNQGLVEGQNTMESLYPGSTQSNREQEFVKSMGASVLAGNAGSAAAGLVPGMAGKEMLPAIFRSAVGGMAGAQPFHYNTGEDRLAGTALGAGIGTAIPPIEAGASSIGKGMGAAKNWFMDVINSGKNLKDVEGQLKNVGTEEAALTAPKDTSYGPLTEGQGTQLGNRALDKARASMVGEAEGAGDSAQQKMIGDYKSKKADLGGKFNQATQNEAEAYKTAMDDARNTNTPLYGERLDALQADLKEPITADEYNQKVIQPTLKQISEKGLPLSGPEANLRAWAQKFSPEAPVAEAGGIPETDYLGMPKNVEQPIAPEKQTVSLRGLNNVKNDIYNSQSYGARMGTAKPEPGDVGASIFQKNHNAFMDSRVPGHAELQADAGPFLESTRNVYKSIRPGEEDLQPGMNMLQKAAKGSANPAKAVPDIERNLARVEKGSGGFKGTGNLRGQSTEIAKNMRDLDLKFTGDKQDLIQQIDKKVSDINNSFGQDSATIERGGRENAQNTLQKQASLSQRQASLESRQQDLKKLKTVRDWAGGAVLGTTGLEGAHKAYKIITGT